jgi:hypothetical protein
MRHARAGEVRRAAVAVALAALAVGAASAHGAPLSDIPAAFLDVGTGAGAMGVAGAVVAQPTGPDAVFWNPAAVGYGAARREFAASYGDHMGLVPCSAVSASVPLGSEYALGAGLLVTGDDVLREMTAVAALARGLPAPPWCRERPTRVGVALRGRRASYGNNESTEGQVTGDAAGGGVDLGVLVPAPCGLTLGVTGRDVVNTLRWNSSARGSYEERVPPALVVGVSAAPRQPLRVEVDLDKALSRDGSDAVAAGASLRAFDFAVIRAGYRRVLSDEAFDEYAVGCGAAVPAGHGRVTLDVAYLFGRLDGTLRFTLGFGL